jgi:hypothetical protein
VDRPQIVSGTLHRIRTRWVPASLIVSGLALLVVYMLRALFAPGLDRLPGTDAGILYAWELFTRSVLAQGQLPYWNPYQFGGTPYLADTQTTVLYPPAALLRFLPPLAFLPWMAALHIWLGGTGMLFLGRVIGLGWPSAAAAAVAVTLGGSVAPSLSNGHLLLIYTTAWLPWALGFAMLSARRPTMWPHPLFVGVLVMQFLAGYLQGSVYIAAAIILYALYSAAWPEHAIGRWRPAGQLAIAGALAIGVSAFQFIPTARLALEAGRTAGLPFDTAAAGGWTVRDLATFVVPFQGIDSDPPHRMMADRVAYVGWLLAGLSPLAFLSSGRRRMSVFFGVLVLVAIGLAFGANLPFYRLHHAIFPGFRIPGRLLFVATLGIAALGAIGLDYLVAAARRRSPPLASAGGWVAALVVAVDLVAFWDGAVQTIPVTDSATVRRWIGAPDGGRALSLCENVVGPHELLGNRQPTFDGSAAMYLRDHDVWMTLAAAEGALPIRRDLLDAANVTTIIACDEPGAPSLSPVSHVDAVRVYRNQEAWPRVIWTCAAEELPRSEVARRLRVGRYDAGRQLAVGYQVNVRWASALPEADRRSLESRYRLLDPEHREGSTWRYRVEDLTPEEIRALLADPAVEDTHGLDRHDGELIDPAADAPPDDPREMLIGTAPCEERHDPEIVAVDRPDGRVAVKVDAATAGVLFFAEPYYPERQAFVDGMAVTPVKANVAFTAVRVPPGAHQVELRYVPGSFRWGSALSAATLAVWAGTAIAGRRRRAARPAATAVPRQPARR